MNVNSIMIGSEDPKRLVDYYTKILGKPAMSEGVCGAFIVSGCLQLTSVLVNQPSKSPTAGHATPTDRLPPLRWLQSARLVRSLLVVVGHVLNEHRAEMALADDQHPVQALAASAAHPPLRMCIGSRSQQWRHHHPGPGRFEDGI